MPPAIRPAKLDDVPAIRALEQQAPSAAHWPAEEYERLVGSEVVLVAEEDGHVRGFVSAKAAADEWELENIVVASSFLRQGTADALLRAFLIRAGRVAATKIFLEVRESNRPARRLYEKHGFRETGRRPDYYHDPPEDAILYTRSLRPQEEA